MRLACDRTCVTRCRALIATSCHHFSLKVTSRKGTRKEDLQDRPPDEEEEADEAGCRGQAQNGSGTYRHANALCGHLSSSLTCKDLISGRQGLHVLA